MSDKEKLKELLQKMTSGSYSSFEKAFSEEMNNEFKEALGEDIKEVEELELFIKVHERLQFIVDEFIEDWIKGKEVTSEELKKIRRVSDWEKEENSYTSSIEDIIRRNSQILGFINKKERLENVIKERKETVKKIDDNFARLGKKNYQSTELNNSKNQKPEKNNYPWAIIISMGTVIATLLGAVIFLLIKNKNKKTLK